MIDFSVEYKLISEIEGALREDVLIYFGEISQKKWGSNFEHRMSNGDSEEIYNLLARREKKTETLCFIIQTAGGEISEAMKIIDLLKNESYTNIKVIVMTYAGSAGAFLSLCGSQLYMTDNSMLSDFGPQNWNNMKSNTASEFHKQIDVLTKLYSSMVHYLVDGVARNNVHKLIGELATPSPDGKICPTKNHGRPILLGYLSTLETTNVLNLSNIEVPGSKKEDVRLVVSKLIKLRKIMTKRMSVNNLGKVIIFASESSYVEIPPVTQTFIDRGLC